MRVGVEGNSPESLLLRPLPILSSSGYDMGVQVIGSTA